MSVVRREARRRLLTVAAGLGVLCLLPAVVANFPGPRITADPAGLRDRILASATRPYQGYVDTHATIVLPEVPAAQDVAELFGTLRLRSWYAAPDQWRVATLETTGERDVYRSPVGTYVWDFERNLTTLSMGELPLRPPTAADLLPPELARRLLSGEPSVAAIGARRVAGVAAAGLRITPAEDDTTIGRVDIWADPQTGLPVQVEITPKGVTDPVFTSRFVDLSQTAPPPAVLLPAHAPSSGFTVTTAEDVAAAINGVAPVPLPPALGGRLRLGSPAAAEVVGLAAYGRGLSTFVVLALPGRVGFDALNAAKNRGGLPVRLDNAEAYQTSTTLVNGLIVRSGGDRRSRRTYVIAGPVTAEVLTQAARELLSGAGQP